MKFCKLRCSYGSFTHLSSIISYTPSVISLNILHCYRLPPPYLAHMLHSACFGGAQLPDLLRGDLRRSDGYAAASSADLDHGEIGVVVGSRHTITLFRRPCRNCSFDGAGPASWPSGCRGVGWVRLMAQLSTGDGCPMKPGSDHGRTISPCLTAVSDHRGAQSH